MATPSDENLDKVKRGNGMIVNFQRGKGEVFHAGSCEWVAGLLRQDADGRDGDEECARPLCSAQDDGDLSMNRQADRAGRDRKAAVEPVLL